jgi:hypothetical protein
VNSQGLIEEQYHTALQSLIFEGQAFWTRITAFVLLNSALLVARANLPVVPSDRWIRLSVGLLGTVTTLLWAHSSLRVHYIRLYWIAMLRDLETRLGIEPTGPFTLRERFLMQGSARLPNGNELRLPWIARGNVDDTTSFVLTIVFLIIWIVALIRAV